MNFTKSLLVLSIGEAIVGYGSANDDITVTCDTAALYQVYCATYQR